MNSRAAVLDAADTSITTVVERYEPAMSISLIVESPKNPRRHFDAEKLNELAASIRERGVLEPVVVRPAWRGDQEVFELASGHRRRRASQLAGAKTVPAIVRVMDDHEFLEVLTIANLQREDVNPIEEAEGFNVLIKEGGFDVESLALKIGKSETYVYTRLKLLALTPAVREALARNFMGLSQAIELGKVDAEAQHEALRVLWRLDHVKLTAAANGEKIEREPSDFDEVEGEAPDQNDEDFLQHLAENQLVAQGSGDFAAFRTKDAYGPLLHVDVGDVRSHLLEQVYVQLSRAPFDVTAAALLPIAGSCIACPKRSGASPTLFPELAGADVCLDRACFHAKSVAHIDAVVEKEQALHDEIDVVRISTEHKAPKGTLKTGMYKPLGPSASTQPAKATAIGVYIDGPARGTAVWIASAKDLIERAAAGKAVKAPAPKSSPAAPSGPTWEERQREQEAAAALQVICCDALQAEMLVTVELNPLDALEALRAVVKVALSLLQDWQLKDNQRAIGDVLCELFALSDAEKKSGATRRAALEKAIAKADLTKVQQTAFVIIPTWRWNAKQLNDGVATLVELLEIDATQILRDAEREAKAARKAAESKPKANLQ